MLTFVKHPIIKPDTIQSRVYQQMLFFQAIKKNTLVILPTGLGKTVVMMMLIGSYRLKHPEMQIIVTAPTRPLVEQHYQNFLEKLVYENDEVGIISGSTPPVKREKLWQKLKLIIATPQTLRNDIINNYVDMKKVSLFCVDEAHRAVKDDSIVLCTQQFNRKSSGRLVGFTASPGNKETLTNVVENLGIDNIEYMNESHPTVKPYVNDIEEELIKLELPDEMRNIQSIILEYTKDNLQILKDRKIIDSIQLQQNPMRKLLALPKLLNEKRGNGLEENDFYKCMQAYGQLMLVSHANELLETQGLISLHSYFTDKAEEQRVSGRKSLKTFLNSVRMKKVEMMTRQLINSGMNHPKLHSLKEIILQQVKKNPESRILVFANYKSTVSFLVKSLSHNEKLKVNRFVGQSMSGSHKGLTQKQQKEIMQNFRSGVFNVLVSTSVGEEGLDVAQCDLVIFYEAISSTTRLIQRKGRTGRIRAGKVIILITKNTRDEIYYYASKKKQRKLEAQIYQVKEEMHNIRSAERNFFEIESGLNESKDEIKETEIKDDIKKNECKEDTDHSIHSNKSNGNGLNHTINGNGSDISTEISNNRPDNQESIVLPELEFEQLAIDETVMVYVDHREKGSAIMRELLDLDMKIIPKSLPIGDYILSDDIAVERKTTEDFGKTLQRGELFHQLMQLKEHYVKPILILEGENLHETSVHRNGILGAIAAITIDMDIRIIYTKDQRETAAMLFIIAKREQLERKKKPQIKKNYTKSLKQKQLNLVGSIPDINSTLAKRLLAHFGTPRGVFSAHPDDLRKVRGIGMTKANGMDVILSRPFEK